MVGGPICVLKNKADICHLYSSLPGDNLCAADGKPEDHVMLHWGLSLHILNA